MRYHDEVCILYTQIFAIMYIIKSYGVLWEFL